MKDLIEPRTDGLPLLHLNTTEASPDQVMKWFGRLIILGVYIPDLNLTTFLEGKVADMSSAMILSKTYPEVVAQAVRLRRLVLSNNRFREYCVTILDVEILWERLQEAWQENQTQAGFGKPAIKAGGTRADGSGGA